MFTSDLGNKTMGKHKEETISVEIAINILKYFSSTHSLHTCIHVYALKIMQNWNHAMFLKLHLIHRY